MRKKKLTEESGKLFEKTEAETGLYEAALMGHDWNYAQSADPKILQKGLEERKHLYAHQARLDDGFRLWDRHAPEGQKGAQIGAAREEYRKNLRSHDWSYNYSDDSRCCNRGADERAVLNGQQRLLDPDGAIWNELAPQPFRRVPAAPPPKP